LTLVDGVITKQDAVNDVRYFQLSFAALSVHRMEFCGGQKCKDKSRNVSGTRIRPRIRVPKAWQRLENNNSMNAAGLLLIIELTSSSLTTSQSQELSMILKFQISKLLFQAFRCFRRGNSGREFLESGMT
jgi:hypothetical protein